MNKAELIDAVVEGSMLSKSDVEKVLNCLCDAIVANVKTGDEVVFGNLGKFKCSNRAARTGRNPRTGETIEIAASRAPTFKAGKAFKDALNG